MSKRSFFSISLILCLAFLFIAACSRDISQGPAGPRTITVAQEGEADVIGSDNTAIQKAAFMCQPGDTLVIAPGTYVMENSLLIPSGIVVLGTPDKTILRKSKGVESFLVDGGDYGERQLVVAEGEKFRAGMGVSVRDDRQRRCWDVTVTTVTEVVGDSLRIDKYALRDYAGWDNHTVVSNVFPILCVVEASDVVLEGLTVDGNKDENGYLTGCRGSAIFLYESRDVIVRNCVVRNFNGDGLSFRCENMKILGCKMYGNTGIGLHPGASHHSVVRDCHVHDNGSNGMYVCWRVRYGLFDDNLIENNGRNGISIGHKDTDNLFTGNTIRGNRIGGVKFRDESFERLGAHRNVFRDNTVTDNGNTEDGRGYGFYLGARSRDVVIENNRIAETRSGAARTQRYGVFVAKDGGPVVLRDNTMEGHLEKDFHDENEG